jgi:hypothetical protein
LTNRLRASVGPLLALVWWWARISALQLGEGVAERDDLGDLVALAADDGLIDEGGGLGR